MGDEGGGLETELWLLISRKLARGGRSRTPERVEPSMAFWSWRRRKKKKRKRKNKERKRKRKRKKKKSKKERQGLKSEGKN